MIFVTVGSRPYPFNRLFEQLDKLYDEKILTEPMFAQIGTSAYIPRNFEYKDFVSPKEFHQYVEQADIVVSHGASGAIMAALNAGKKVIAVSRLEKYGEHVNDHQVTYNSALEKRGYVLRVDNDLTNLGNCFQKIYDGKDGLKAWENQDPQAILELIDKFIQENW